MILMAGEIDVKARDSNSVNSYAIGHVPSNLDDPDDKETEKYIKIRIDI